MAPKDAKEFTVTVRWGDYEPIFDEVPPGAEKPAQPPLPKAWKRMQRSETLTVQLPQSQKPVERDVPKSGGLKLALAIRPVLDIPAFEQVQQKGARSVSLFVVNRRKPAPDDTRDTAFVFQAQLGVESEVPLVPRPNLRGVGIGRLGRARRRPAIPRRF